MSFESHIIDYLRLHRQVIIPDVGQLKLVHQNAQSKTGTIAPPRETIIFSNREKSLQLTLVNYMSSVTDKSATTVEKEFIAYAKSILDGVKKGRRVRFGNVGYFHQDKAYQVLFVPDAKAVQLLGDQFGLEPVKLKKTKVEHKKAAPASRKYAILWLLLGLILLLGFATFIISKKYVFGELLRGNFVYVDSTSTEIEEGHEMVYDLPIPDSSEVDSDLEDPIKIKEDDHFESIGDTLEVEEDFYAKFSKFYLIVGSFDSKRKANLHMKRVRREGYIPDLLHSDDRYRVSIGLYSDREKALKKLYELRAQDKTIWILSTN